MPRLISKMFFLQESNKNAELELYSIYQYLAMTYPNDEWFKASSDKIILGRCY